MNTATVNISDIGTFYGPLKFKGRVGRKSKLRCYGIGNNDKWFDAEIKDSTGAIKCLAFNEVACHLFDMLQENHVYVIENGSVNVAHKHFNYVTHGFEVTFNGTTKVTEVEKEFLSHGNLIPLSDTLMKSNNSYIDTVGVLVKMGDIQNTKKRNTGEDLILRSLVLADSNVEVSVTLWNGQVTSFSGDVGDVIGIIKAKVNEFNGVKRLSLAKSAEIMINPLWLETDTLKRWYSAKGQSETRIDLSQQICTPDESQSFSEATEPMVMTQFLENILDLNKEEQEGIKRRLQELEGEEERIKAEKNRLAFKKQRLEKENKSIVTELDDEFYLGHFE